MTLDPRGGAGTALDHVRVQGPLDQEPGLPPLASGDGLEHPDELLPDDLALLFGIGDAGQAPQEELRLIRMDEGNLEVMAERLDDVFGLPRPHQPGIDEHAREVLPDGLVHQERGHAGIHPAGERAQDLSLTHLEPDALDRPLDDVRGRPFREELAGVVEESLQDLLAPRRVNHLGVELDPVEPSSRILHRRDRRGGGPGGDGEPGWCFDHRVGVAHPHRLLRQKVGQQHAGLCNHELRPAVLPKARGLDPAPQGLGHGLLAVADPEHGHSQLEQPVVDRGGPFGIHRRGPSGQDQAGRPAGFELLQRGVERDDLGVHVALPDPPRDELGVLGPEVDDEDWARVGHRGRSYAIPTRWACWSRLPSVLMAGATTTSAFWNSLTLP